MSEQGFWERQIDDPIDSEQGWLEEPEAEQTEPPSQEIIALLNLGELEAKLNVRDHDIILRTLKMDEELEVGLLVQRYRDTLEEGRALATALVAASIKSIDGKPIVATLGPEENLIRRKFDYVRTRMYWPAIRIIYEEGYLPLVEQQVKVLDEFRKK